MSRPDLGEFDWFAVDGSGHIGHFVDAGFGPVPAAVFARLHELRDLNKRILQLPVVGSAKGHLSGSIDDWLEMARRGLFSYDWKHWKGPYRRAATPSHPISLADVPAHLRELLQVVTWPEVRLADSWKVRPEELCACE